MLASLAAARGETQSMLERQREFVADASHELRTPLTSVLANLELLTEELEGEQAGMIFVDGVDIGDPADVALRDRRMLSGDGIFIVVTTVSEQSGESVVPPEVIFRGVPFIEQADSLIVDIREEVERSLARAAQDGVREIDMLQQELHDDLAAFVYDRLRRRPMVLPVVVEV